MVRTLRMVEVDDALAEEEEDEQVDDAIDDDAPSEVYSPEKYYGGMENTPGVWRWVPALLGFFGISGSALIVCVLAAFVSNATAIVKDVQTKEPIANVVIKRDDDKEFESTSDHSGLFRPNGDLSAEPSVFLTRLFGKFKLSAEKEEYESLSATFSPLDFVSGDKVIYLKPKADGTSGQREGAVVPTAAETEPINVPEVLSEINELFNKEGFILNDRLHSPNGNSFQRSYVISEDAENAISEKIQTVLPILQTEPQAMKLYMDNNRTEAVAIGLYRVWDGAGGEVRNKVSFFLFETLLNMQSRYRCKNNVDGWQKAREFRKRAYYHFMDEFPHWLEGPHAKCAAMLGTGFADLMISADAAPVDDGEKKRSSSERTAAALNQRTELFSRLLEGINGALSNKTLSPTCEEVKWAKRKLTEIAGRAESGAVFNQPSVKQAWSVFQKQNIPACSAEPQCHCLSPRAPH